MTIDKIQHTSTDQPTVVANLVEVINSKIGLTALQEKCAIMLAAGTSITDTAAALNIDRGTIYCWKKKVTFSCNLNRLQQESKEMLQGGLLDLQGHALQALQEALTSENEAVKLKASIWLLEKLDSMKVGASDPKEVIREICTEDIWPDVAAPILNKNKYKTMLQEEGLELDE